MTDQSTEFYKAGEALPAMHPDQQVNAELLIQALCGHLDTARLAIAKALEMRVVSPELLQLKDHLRWAMDETSPTRLTEKFSDLLEDYSD